MEKPIEVTSIATFMDAIKDVSKDGIVLYRGHADKGWKLIPSVGRGNYSLWKEKNIFFKFKSQYYLYAEDRPITDIHTLFLAQHYGLPTRLLDWSYNPLVALWNACQDAKEDKDAKENKDGKETKEDKDGCIHIVQIPQKDVDIEEGHDLDNDIFGEKNTDMKEGHNLDNDILGKKIRNYQIICFLFQTTQIEDF